MDCHDVGDYFGLLDFVFGISRVLAVGGNFVCSGVWGDVFDGGYKYDRADSGAGCVAEPGHGGVRDDVYGRAADWVADRGWGGEAYWCAADFDGVWRDCAGSEFCFCVSGGDAVAAAAGGSVGTSGGLGGVSRCPCRYAWLQRVASRSFGYPRRVASG